MKAANCTLSLLWLNLWICGWMSLSLCLTKLRQPPPAPSPSVWFMRSDLSDSTNPSADFIRSLFPVIPSMCLLVALGDFSVAYGNVLPPIIVYLVPWYHSPPFSFPSDLHPNDMPVWPPSSQPCDEWATLIYIIQLELEEYKWKENFRNSLWAPDGYFWRPHIDVCLNILFCW